MALCCLAQYSQLKDQRSAAATLLTPAADDKIQAAIQLMVGPKLSHRWTPAGKERLACELCGNAGFLGFDCLHVAVHAGELQLELSHLLGKRSSAGCDA